MTASSSARSSANTVGVVVGPDEHGVVRHALTVVAAAGSAVVRLRHFAECDHADVPATDGCLAHLHYTDALFGPDADSSATCFCHLARRLARPLIVTLHDVPTPTHSARDRRRVATYRRVAACADALVVSSAHELALARAGGIDRPITVIPIPIAEPVVAERSAPLATGPRVVAVLGFIYPGKGHDDLVDVLADLPADVELWALGRASDGHGALAEALVARSRAAGRTMGITGFLDDTALAATMRRVDVPVAPARAPSASASLSMWIGEGRRVVTAVNPYSAELAAAGGRFVRLYRPEIPGALLSALTAALDDPASTWHTGAIPTTHTSSAVGARHRRLYHDVLERRCGC